MGLEDVFYFDILLSFVFEVCGDGAQVGDCVCLPGYISRCRVVMRMYIFL